MYIAFEPLNSNTPACVNRLTGKITINTNRWQEIPENLRDFILEHEKGHYLEQTKSEIDADNYAFRQLAGKKPFSLKNAVKAISETLSFNNQNDWDRLNNIFTQALIFDAKNYNNKNALKKLETMTNQGYSFYEDDQISNFKIKNPLKGFKAGDLLRPATIANKLTGGKIKVLDKVAGLENKLINTVAKPVVSAVAGAYGGAGGSALANTLLADPNDPNAATKVAARNLETAENQAAYNKMLAENTALGLAPSGEEKLFGMPKKTAYIVIAAVIVVVLVGAFFFFKKK